MPRSASPVLPQPDVNEGNVVDRFSAGIRQVIGTRPLAATIASMRPAADWLLPVAMVFGVACAPIRAQAPPQTSALPSGSAVAVPASQYEVELAAGEALLRAGLYSEARVALVKATEAGQTPEARSNAALLAKKASPSIWAETTRKLGDLLQTSVATLAIGVLGFFLLMLLRPAVKEVGAFVSKRRGQRSRTVVLQDFADATATGLGVGLPDLVRSLYFEQLRLAQAGTSGGLLVPYRDPGSLPLLSPAESSAIDAIDLKVAGVEVGRIFAWLERIWNTPRHNVCGTVYRTRPNAIRATVWIKPVSGDERTWDGPLSGDQQLHDMAYRIVFALLDDGGQ